MEGGSENLNICPSLLELVQRFAYSRLKNENTVISSHLPLSTGLRRSCSIALTENARVLITLVKYDPSVTVS